MSKFSFVVLLIGSASAADLTALVSQTTTGSGETRGVVTLTNCESGGRGTLLATRVTDCTALACDLNPGTVLELDFRTSVNIGRPTIRLTITYSGASPATSLINVDGSIGANVPMRVRLRGFSGEMLTRELTLRAELLTDAGDTEICVSYTFNKKGSGSEGRVIGGSVAAVGALLLGATQLNGIIFNY